MSMKKKETVFLIYKTTYLKHIFRKNLFKFHLNETERKDYFENLYFKRGSFNFENGIQECLK